MRQPVHTSHSAFLELPVCMGPEVSHAFCYNKKERTPSHITCDPFSKSLSLKNHTLWIEPSQTTEYNGGCHRWEHFYPATFKVKYAFQRGRASVQNNDSHQSVFRLCSISIPEDEVPSVVLPCTHQTEHCREPGHENSAGFSLKVCAPNAKSLSRPYRS